ncbi:SGNH/GDSL hydrolase family protein [Clavibacter michiganensis subsp. michiganensis]|uniref:Ig-like domain-containing protein n=1 Tax=Clavibacter michiganensis TaxID=28447 RepID=UPI001C64654D|nr:Ig-like domain-containing protein [Clavibacter michiganensis]MBW8025281.1 SGNH/GDSL hydrolase family protein [Clavibacter michiganensis subsp. michiganensis]
MADPAPKTSSAAFRKREMSILQSCTQKGVVILLQTNSINQVESIDGRYGSWWGGLQRNLDAAFQVASIQALIKAQPTPVVAGLEGYKLRALAFEPHLSRTTWDVANVYGMAPTGRVSSFNYQHGRGLQSTNQTAGQVRTQVSVATAMECYVATQKKGDSYKVAVDGVEIANITATADGRKWRKHEKIGMPAGEHTMTVTFVSGTCLFDAIDTHLGSERKGIRVVNAGRSGVSLNSFAKTGPASDPDQKWAEVHPLLADDQVSGVDIGLMTLGTNNMGDPEDAFEQMLEEYVTRFFEVNKNAVLHLMFDAQPNAIPANGDDWQGKHRAAKRVASRHAWVSVDSLWAGEVAGRIPRIENTRSDLIKGLHPKSKLYLGDLLPYGYAKTSASILDQSAFTGVAPDPGEDEDDGDGGPTQDVTPPSIAVITGDNLTVNPDGTFTIAADITDTESAIGIAVVRTTDGDLLGNLVKTEGSRYELTLTWQQLRAFLEDDEELIRWFIVAYDAPGNRAPATGARSLTVKLRTTAPADPVVANITATGFDVPGSPITISADVTHASGIELVPLNIEGVYRDNLLRPATGNRWSQTFDRVLFQDGDDYAVGARSNAQTTFFSNRIPYVLAGTVKDVSAPTGRMTKPITNTTLPDLFTLEAYAVDNESGVKKVQFFVDQVLLTDAEYIGSSLFSAPATLQQIRDTKYAIPRIRARLEDKAGNYVFTDWVTFSVPDAPVVVAGAVLPFLDGDDFLPVDPAVREAWEDVFGGSGPGTGTTVGFRPDGTPFITY